MAEKDITEKLLEDYNDVFADIINVLIYKGKRLIDENDLEAATTRSQYKEGNQIHGQERDVSKYWNKRKVKFTLFGFENQSSRDSDEPLRIIGYDGASYRDEINHGSERYLVFTFVLYFGTDHRWGQKSRSLFRAIGKPDPELQPYANDYHVNVFEIAWLSDETVAKFKSDFRIVADYFVQMRKNKQYIASTEEIKHVEEVLNLMYVMTGNKKFEQAQNSVHGKQEVKTMKDWLDIECEKWEAKGRLETMDSFLETCVEDGVTCDSAIRKLKRIYKISQEEAEACAQKYYPQNGHGELQPA